MKIYNYAYKSFHSFEVAYDIMKILVLYGFHKQEREFGKHVCDEFNQRYPEAREVVSTLPINNFADEDNERQEEIAFWELISKMKKYKPEILINMHHNKHMTQSIREQSNKAFRHFGLVLSILFGLVGAFPLAEHILSPFWKYYRWWIPSDVHVRELFLNVVSLAILLSIVSVLWKIALKKR